MPDSTLVLPPGWRAIDPATGVPLPGAVVIFYEALTDDARDVFGLASLAVGSTLGNEVTCDSGGYPTSDGNSKTLIWTGTDPYRIRLETSTGVQVFDHDLVTGALNTSSFGGDATISTPITNSSSNQTIGVADNGKLYVLNCSGSDIDITMGLAAVLEDDFRVGFRHAGTANQLKFISGDSDEGFILPGMRGTDAGITTAITDAFALTTFGQEVWLRCDGANFVVGEPTPPALNLTGIWLIEDRLSTPPGSPPDGGRYIVTTSPTGAWVNFSVHDVAEADGQGGWIRYTPATDCGWIAYVKDEDLYYKIRASAWVKEFAEQPDMEAGTSLALPVTPGMQKHHPAHAKAWGYANVSGSLLAGFGISSVTDGGAGICTFNLSTAMSSATDYLAIGHTEQSGVGRAPATISPKTASSVEVRVSNFTSVLSDGTAYGVLVFGDQ